MNKIKTLSGELIALLLFIIIIKTVDVAAIGPEGTKVGLSHINGAFHNLTGINMALYNITEYLGYAAIMLVAVWGLNGLLQLISRRSIKKVDREILILGALFVALAAVYAIFELVIINYRPIIMPGDTAPEASFPSSHTILGCVVLIATAMAIDRYMKGRLMAALIKLICSILCAVLVIGRLFCGVHWLTDIVGGIIISVILLTAMSAALETGKR